MSTGEEGGKEGEKEDRGRDGGKIIGCMERESRRDIHVQCCMQKMWLGVGKLSFQNVGGQRCIQCINFSKV